MIHIILLADQERLIRLFTASDAMSGFKVHVVAGIDDALAARASRGTNIFFIQHRLGGVSGEVIAHRLGAELKGKKARILLLGDPAVKADSDRKAAHEVIDAGLPDTELIDALLRIISAPPSRLKKPEGAERNKADTETQDTVPPLITETVDDVVEIQQRSAPRVEESSGREPSGPATAPGHGRSRFLEELESARETQPGTKVEQRRILPKTPGLQAEPSTGPILVKWGKPSLVSRILDRLAGSKGWIIAAVAVVCVVLSLQIVFRKGKPPIAKGVAGKSKPGAGVEVKPLIPPPLHGLKSFPSFIPRLSQDLQYGKTHPGWESYRNASAEFRLFREKGVVMGLQVIDRGGKGVTPSMLTSALTEIAGSSQYLIETKERKGGYLVEKGRLKNGAGIIIYRNVQEGKVKAFVLDFH